MICYLQIRCNYDPPGNYINEELDNVKPAKSQSKPATKKAAPTKKSTVKPTTKSTKPTAKSTSKTSKPKASKAAKATTVKPQKTTTANKYSLMNFKEPISKYFNDWKTRFGGKATNNTKSSKKS